MTAAELKLKAENFTAGMDDRDLAQMEEILDDLRAVRECDAISAQRNELVSWEKVEARLGKKFGIKFA
ncbi:MAG: hypothetical protein LBK76_00875 [Verrucomicrobiales bacterium]|nr:hypothetical protein [Verrucomicrobiales bacterium]